MKSEQPRDLEAQSLPCVCAEKKMEGMLHGGSSGEGAAAALVLTRRPSFGLLLDEPEIERVAQQPALLGLERADHDKHEHGEAEQ